MTLGGNLMGNIFFLKIGAIFACFQSSGTSPFSRELDNIIFRIRAAALAVSLRTLDEACLVPWLC